MKINYYIAVFLTALSLTARAQRPSINGYTVYYGSLHNHSQICGHATGTPAEVYAYAKNITKLDFFSMAEHDGYNINGGTNYYPINESMWQTVKDAANNTNQDGTFTALWGFEWSSTNDGHVAVIGTDDFTTTWANNSFSKLCDWLSVRDGVAFFNHPGRQNGTNTEFGHFVSAKSDKFVGMELWNKTSSFETYYYNDGYVIGDGKSYFDEANNNGWKIGAAGSFDNHSATPGLEWNATINTMVPNNQRLAILAKNLNRTEILSALKARRFFSTTDCNIALSFCANSSEMGSTIVAGATNITIKASDSNGEVFTKVELRKNGNVLSTWTPNTTNPNISFSVSSTQGNDFYYVKVTQADGDEAISSPIFVNASLQSIVKQVTSGNDDVEENIGGYINTNSSDLELPQEFNTQTVGLRYMGLNIPKGATINTAYIQFTTDATSSEATTLTIKGHAHDNSPAFTTTNYNLDNRLKTTSSVSWSPSAWSVINESGINQQTPNLKAILQEIVNRTSYSSASAISILINGSGKRVAKSYETSALLSPKITVTYTPIGTTLTYTVSKNIASGLDDVEQYSDGWMYISSSDLELVYDHLKQYVGLRFSTVNIPPNASINNAYVQFVTDETNGQTTTIYIKGEASDNSLAFNSTPYNVSNRMMTTASSIWSPSAWNVLGEASTTQRTPNLKSIIQEIVNRAGYSRTSALSLIFYGTTGFRVASSYESSPTLAPKLVVEYTSTLKSGYEEESISSILAKDSVHKTDISIYPIPAENYLFVNCSENYTIKYNIVDIYGKVIAEGEVTNNSIDIQNIPSGFYVIILNSANNKKYFKFCK